MVVGAGYNVRSALRTLPATAEGLERRTERVPAFLAAQMFKVKI